MNQFQTEMQQKFESVSDEIDKYLKNADENEKELIERQRLKHWQNCMKAMSK